MGDPFKIDGPALISFSGGRTSGYMLWRILQAHGGTLPEDVKVTFANTGKEMPQTLDFVRDCGERWGVEIVWLQYKDAEETKDRWERVTYETAARKGEPFDALINRKGYLPNPVMRFCTAELKIRVMRDYARSLGWKNWTNVIGLRADEPGRVARARNNRDPWDNAMPLAVGDVTRRDIQDFWSKQNFDLRLPNINGTTPAGNCDLCFLKSTNSIIKLLGADPALSDWWVAAEARAKTLTPTGDGARFRKDRPSYSRLSEIAATEKEFSDRQRTMFPDEARIDCFCMEDAA